MKGRVRRTRNLERGSVLPLIIGFGVSIVMLTVVVIDATQVWIYKRALHSVADGASLAAANALDPGSVYDGGVGETVVLNPQRAQTAVDDYVEVTTSETDEDHNIDRCVATVDGAGNQEVTVRCDGQARLPFVSFIAAAVDQDGRIPVSATASAQTFSVDG